MVSTMILPEQKKLYQLQSLRFLAFICVFCMHTLHLTGDWFCQNLCVCAVSFFFILSGFVSGYQAYNKENRLSWSLWLQEIKKRFKKIYPLHLVTLLLSFVLLGGVTQAILLRDGEKVVSLFVQLGKCLLLVQSWFPTRYFELNGVSWFVSTLMFLYMMNQPLLYIVKKIKSGKNGHYRIIGVALAVFLLLTVYCYLTQNLHVEFWQYIFPPSRLAEYFMGICLGLLYNPIIHWIDQRSVSKLLYTCVEVVCIVVFFAVVTRIPTHYWGYRVLYWIFPNIALIGVFMCNKGYISDLLSAKPFVRLGNASFEFFLIHIIIIQSFIAINGANDTNVYTNMIQFLMCLGITLVVGLYIHEK